MGFMFVQMKGHMYFQGEIPKATKVILNTHDKYSKRLNILMMCFSRHKIFRLID